MNREITKEKGPNPPVSLSTHPRLAPIYTRAFPASFHSISLPCWLLAVITDQQRSGSLQANSAPCSERTRSPRKKRQHNRGRGSELRRHRHGEVAVLREGAHEQGRVDKGGGPAPDRLHQGARRGVLALSAQGRGPPALRQELPPPLDELPPPGPQARQLHRRRRRAHHQAPRPARQQVVVDRGAAAGPDGQRDQELLEHAHQAQAPQPRHRPADAPPAQRQRPHHLQHGRLPVPGTHGRSAPGHHRPCQCDVRRIRAVLGRRPKQQRWERREHGRAAVPRPQPGPRPVRGPAVLAAQDASHHRLHAHVAAAPTATAYAHLPVLPPRSPGQRGLHLQDGLAIAGVPVSQATRGGTVHMNYVK